MSMCRNCFTCQRCFQPQGGVGGSFPEQVNDLRRFKQLTVCNTYKCNLKCHYCYQSKENYELDREGIFQVVKCSLDYAVDRQPSVWWFGGEPLLQWRDIRDATMWFLREGKLMGLNPSWGFTTNGVLLRGEIVDYVYAFNGGLLLSIDGDKFSHDRFRVFPDGSGSFDIVWRNALAFAHGGAKFQARRFPQVRYTIMPENASRLVEGVEFLWRNGFKNVVPLPVCEVEWDEDIRKVYVSQVKELTYRWLKMFLRSPQSVAPLKWVSDAERYLNVSSNIGRRSRGCGMGGNALGVNPRGEITLCQRLQSDEFVIGDIWNGIDVKKRRKWLRYSCEDFHSEVYDCELCPLRGRCCGFCKGVNVDVTGDYFEVPEFVCWHEVELFKIGVEAVIVLRSHGLSTVGRQQQQQGKSMFISRRGIQPSYCP